MQLATHDVGDRAETSEERTLLVLEALGTVVAALRLNGHEEQMEPEPIPVQERIRRLPEALLLTAGYYASRAPAVSELARSLRQRH